LIDRSYPGEDNSDGKQWKRFEAYVSSLEAAKKEGESFKVLFLGRHGEGWHNVAEAKYGTKAWDVRSPRPLFPNVLFHLISPQTTSESGSSSKGVDYGFTPTFLPTLLFTPWLHQCFSLICVLSFDPFFLKSAVKEKAC
jgi:hypothetical protein